MNVNCPHCKVSIEWSKDYAGEVVSCPSCGGEFQMPSVPVANVASDPRPVHGHVTIEKTSKNLKLFSVLIGLVFFVSVIGAAYCLWDEECRVSFSGWAVTVAISAILYISNRIAIWWNHG